MWPQSPPDPGFAERFSAALARLSGDNDARILLAVSGGPDSLALLILTYTVCPERIVAATVDHGLRPEAAAEAEFVAGLCAKAGIEHAILRPSEPITGNLQSAARGARYALLTDHAAAQNCAWIATAHHGDDQIETMLMRLARGSGVDGLSGVRACNGQIIRPLLDFTKAELEAICASAGIEPVRDPSNDDADFDRVAMRRWLAQGEHPFTPARTQRSATALADASEALGWMAEKLANERISAHAEGVKLDANGLPAELQRRLVLTALRTVDAEANPRGEAMDKLLTALQNGERVSSGAVDCLGGDIWRFRPAPPRRG